MKLRTIFLSLLGLALVAACSANVSNYHDQGGALWHVGGELDIDSGGILDVKSGASWKIAGTAVTATAAQLNRVDATSSIQTQMDLKASAASPAFTGPMTATGSLTGDGGDAISGFLQKQVAATATTITAAQCGSTFINTGAVQMELPEASTALGCRLTFITGNASNFDVNPDNADQILVLTNAAGDAIRNATLGNSVTLEAISASQWTPVAISGTYSDIN